MVVLDVSKEGVAFIFQVHLENESDTFLQNAWCHALTQCYIPEDRKPGTL
jgi:hypothetical protein